MFKKLNSLLLAIIFVFCATSCNNDNTNETPITKTVTKTNQKAENSKTYKYFKDNFNSNEYTLTLTSNNEEGSEVVTIGMNKEGVLYEDEVTPSSHETTISVKGIRTVIIHHAEAYYTESYDESSIQNGLFNSDDFKGKLYNSGTEIISGKDYYYEEFKDEYGTLCYCFDGDRLAYMVKITPEKSIYIEISNILNSFDESLLNVPSTYEFLDY